MLHTSEGRSARVVETVRVQVLARVHRGVAHLLECQRGVEQLRARLPAERVAARADTVLPAAVVVLELARDVGAARGAADRRGDETIREEYTLVGHELLELRHCAVAVGPQ